MVNNLEQIKSLLEFNSEDEFYFVQIIQRKKDNPEVQGTSNKARVIQTYYITSVEHLERKFEEIKVLCELYNARAGINLNKRSFERVGFHMLKDVTDHILNKDFKHINRSYNTVCGKFTIGDKKWIIDIDDPNQDEQVILDVIDKCKPDGSKYITKIPTKNGYHIISKPFAINEFNRYFYEITDKFYCETIDIHKNNPTILYIP